MPRRAAALAKLTPPRLYAITRRERLFTLVDEKCRHHSLVWIAGPPGAGKTSLIASYLAEHKQCTLWYHVDPGDADLATFFHYLAQAAQAAAGQKRLHLPALTPGISSRCAGIYETVHAGTVVESSPAGDIGSGQLSRAADRSSLHEVLSLALAEFPHGAALIVISRKDALESFARKLMHNGVGRIRWG